MSALGAARSAEDAATRLGVSRRTVERLFTSGAIRTTKVGRQNRTTDQWIDEYLERRASGGRGRRRVGVA